MDDGTGDLNQFAPLVKEFGFLELPVTDPDNRLFIASGLAERYSERKHKYVLIMHRLRKEHFIIGVYGEDDLKAALQTRYVTNLVLNGGAKFSEAFVAMVHDDRGNPIGDQYYDPKTDTIKQFEEKADSENDSTETL